MLNDEARDRIGRELRRTYETMPKGGIPERIWVLLLLIEHDRGVRERGVEIPAARAG